MLTSDAATEAEIREFCKQMLKENEEKGGSPEETKALQHRINVVLNTFGDEMPFVSCRTDFKEFDMLQPETTETLMDIEGKLYTYGYEAGVALFKKAIAEFFQIEKEVLLVMEKERPALFETFKNQYLLKHMELLFIDIAEIFEDQGVSFTRIIFNTEYGQCHSNTVYQLYVFLYENASKERKRAIQSVMQKRGVTVKDLKRSSRRKS